MIMKMSDDIEWLMDHLNDNIIIEIQGMSGGKEIKLVIEVPINPDFLEWAKDKYKIDYLGWNRQNVKPRHYYKIESIGE